jgi:hypothetical protein
VEYTVNAAKTAEVERFAQAWIVLDNRHGGTRHGYFLPGEGASDRGLALFSFPSFADETHRARFGVGLDFVAADKIRDDSGCVLRYERSFMRPLLAELTDE